MSEIEFWQYEVPQPKPAGVTSGYLYLWSGEPGPAKVLPLALLHDGQGGSVVEQTGEWADVTVVAD